MKKKSFQIIMNLIVDIDSEWTQFQILEKIVTVYKDEIGCESVCFMGKTGHDSKKYIIPNSIDSKFKNLPFFDNLHHDKYSEEEFVFKNLNGFNYNAFLLPDFGWLILITKQKLQEEFLDNIKKPILYLKNKLELSSKIKSENQIKKRLNIQSNLVDEILSGVIIVNLDGSLFYLNQIAKKWTGIKDKHLKNFKFFDIELNFKNQDKHKWLEHVKQLKQVEDLKFEGQIRNVSNNKITFTDVIFKYLSISGREFIIANLIDTTQNLDSRKRLNEEIELQDLLLKVAGDYLNINYNEIEETVNKSLGEIGSYVNTDRVYIFDYDFKAGTCSNTYEWCAEGVSPEIKNLQDIPIQFFPEWIKKHKKNEPFIVENTDNLPDTGEQGLKAILSAQNIKSLITLPMFDGNHLIGFVGFDSVFNLNTYSVRQIKLLKLFSHMLVNMQIRKKWEDNFRVQRQRYISIINDVNIGLLEVDKDLRIRFINNNLCQLLGYKDEELINLSSLKTFLDHESQAHIQDKLLTIKEGQNISMDMYLYDKTGIKKPALMSMCRLMDKSGSFKGYLGTFVDLEKQKAIEHTLKTAKEKAEDASRAKEIFLANISHEMRTPLHIINGTLSEVMKTGLDNSQSFLLERGNLASVHLLNLVNNVLDIAKIESNEIELNFKSEILYKKVREVFEMLKPLAEDKKIDLNFDCKINPKSEYLFDVQKLEQVLINLISNSIKFTETGSVDFTVEIIENDDAYTTINFKVKDTGIGMNQKFQKGLFENFKRENDFGIIANEGTGLGLPISKKLVNLMGGDIKVKSKKKKGSEFSFILELTKGSLVKKNAETKKDFKAIDGKKILVVEDNLMSQILIKKKLKRLGADISLSNDGLEAIKVLKKERFDMLLIDMQMPNLDGLETVKVIREDLGSTVPIIILTANVYSSNIERLKAYKIQDYVLKPFEDETLFNAITDVFKKGSSILN